MVSLVPSLTEAVASVRREALVGATDWCTHPADLEVTRVRGTKNPNLARIVELAPDVVIANQEENRRLDVERLRTAGLQVWVTRIESVAEALTSMRRLFAVGLGWPVPAWLDEAEHAWSAPPATRPRRVVVPIWRDPWMAVGAPTYTCDLLARLGLVNALADRGERYPRLSLDELLGAAPDLVILPDEPYAFSPADGPEAFPGMRVLLVEGRLLTWYGPCLAYARGVLERAFL